MIKIYFYNIFHYLKQLYFYLRPKKKKVQNYRIFSYNLINFNCISFLNESTDLVLKTIRSRSEEDIKFITGVIEQQ